jgi:hypothetical protein
MLFFNPSKKPFEGLKNEKVKIEKRSLTQQRYIFPYRILCKVFWREIQKICPPK